MKAYYSTSFGGPEASVYGDFSDPLPRDKQLLAEVKAVSINPVDFKIKRGDLKFVPGSKFPRIFGSDFSGIVKETGSGVTKFKAGDRIYGVTPVIYHKQGALAQLLAIDQKNAMHIPEGMTFEEAASLPIAALTALNGLRRCGVKAGTSVLINGATGGVGHFAVQIAKAKGAVVTATCSPDNVELARKLGADETTGYKSEDLLKVNTKYDAILDAYGKMDLKYIRKLLKRRGTYASTMVKPMLFFSALFVRLAYGRKLTSSNLRSRPEDIEEIENLFHEKKLYPVIENYFTLEKAGEAFQLAEHGKPRGKIIVRVT
jgi:NADPH:quinone reductase-like Zn-dependent oxidoreductase